MTKNPPVQEIVFKFIVEYKQNHDGNSPTMREIMYGCDITTTSLISFYLGQLERSGKIRWPRYGFSKRSSATIEVIGGNWLFIGGRNEHS
jgi:SOS-response transcriptional repressor LexA